MVNRSEARQPDEILWQFYRTRNKRPTYEERMALAKETGLQTEIIRTWCAPLDMILILAGNLTGSFCICHVTRFSERRRKDPTYDPLPRSRSVNTSTGHVARGECGRRASSRLFMLTVGLAGHLEITRNPHPSYQRRRKSLVHCIVLQQTYSSLCFPFHRARFHLCRP